jgi:drug/metabolite transporter (DMT)-like permease
MTEAQRQFRLQVITAFTLVYILWGSTYLAIGIAVEHVSPPMMGASRFIVAGLIMLGARKLMGNPISVSRNVLFRLTVIGTLLLVTGNVVLGWAEQMIPTGLAALLIAITPLWFLLLERFSHKGERIPLRGLVGIAFGIVGVVLLLWPKLRLGFNVGQKELFAAGLVMCSSFSWATGSVLSKRWHMPVDPYTASGWEMLMAGIINFFVSVAIGDLHRTHFDWQATAAIGYLVIAGSLVGFTAYVWLLKNVPTSKVSTYAYVNPIVAVFLGAKPKKAAPEESLELPAVESSGD